jgi:cyclopropane fatty-acyl-phospholipid synthase-like methyltransferase
MAADGMDSGFARLDEARWSAGVMDLAGRLGLAPGTSVFEVGCGAGALLYVLAQRGFSVAGVDRSATLLARAAEVMPCGSFAVADAAALDLQPGCDAVVSFGVFLYFRSERYAELVAQRMRAKAKRVVAVLDLPDRAKQAEAIAYRQRLAGGSEAYAKRYAGLEHRYYDREWAADTLTALGLVDVRVEDQSIASYGNARQRFNGWGFVPP